MGSSIVTTSPSPVIAGAGLPLLPPIPAMAIPGTPENAASTSAILGVTSAISDAISPAPEAKLTLTNWSRFSDSQLKTVGDDLAERLDKMYKDADPELRNYVESQLSNLQAEQRSRRTSGESFTAQDRPAIASNTYGNSGRGSGEPVAGVPKLHAQEQGKFSTESLPAGHQAHRTESPIQEGNRSANRIDGSWAVSSTDVPYLSQAAGASTAGGRIAEMPVGSSALLGSNPSGGGITVKGDSVSGNHAIISRTNDDTWVVQDRGSRYGTTVNNGMGTVGANIPTTVGPGSVITAGDVQVQIPPRVVMHTKANHPQLIGRDGTIKVSDDHGRVSRNHVITSLRSDGNFDVQVESSSTSIVNSAGQRQPISDTVQVPPGTVLALGPSYLVKLESARSQGSIETPKPTGTDGSPGLLSKIGSLFSRTEPAPTIQVVRDGDTRHFPSAPPGHKVQGSGEARIEIGGQTYPIPNNGYLEVNGVQLYRHKSGGWGYRGQHLKSDWNELPTHDHDMTIERTKGGPLKFRFIAPPYNEIGGIPTISLPSLSQRGVLHQERAEASKHSEDADLLLKAGKEHQVMAHGVELGKGGLNNLVGIAITDKVHSRTGPIGYFGILADGPSDLVAGPHGPYWVAEGKDKRFDFIVPSEASKARFFNGLTDAAQAGLCDQSRAQDIASRTFTYKEYTAKLHQRRGGFAVYGPRR